MACAKDVSAAKVHGARRRISRERHGIPCLSLGYTDNDNAEYLWCKCV